MKTTFKIFWLIFVSISLQAIEINHETSDMDILSKSSIYYDNTNSLGFNEVQQLEFEENSQSVLNLGIAPQTALWIKFSLKNTSNKELVRILEYANPETEEILFFEDQNVIKDGMFHHREDRTTLNPIFKIRLKPLEEKNYYIKAHCKISTMIVKLTLYEEIAFLHQNFTHTLMILMFFAVILTLLGYNFMIFIFTKDMAYFYYVFYLSTMLIFQSIYLGVAQLYFFSNNISQIVTQGTIGYISLLLIPIILFVMEFLNTKQFVKIHQFFKFYLYLLPTVSILSFDNFIFNLNVMVIFFPLAFMLIFVGVYAYRQGVKEAQYYLVGWSALIISLNLSVYEAMGGVLESDYFTYMNEVAFMFEAFMFSIALAHRIKIISKAKTDADKKLINFQRKEQELLETLVEEKTMELRGSLEEKEILYKELNHRVKNNLQMILSLIKLQINQTLVANTKEELTVTKNRISSIAELYEILHLRGDSKHFNTLSYFTSIVKSIQDNFSKDVVVNYSIEHNISINDSIYCGLIVNELVTNSFKYAFEESGIIEIRMFIQDGKNHLVVNDNGKGFQKIDKTSLGLTIVQTLSKKQLLGDVISQTDKGVQTTIIWDKNE